MKTNYLLRLVLVFTLIFIMGKVAGAQQQSNRIGIISVPFEFWVNGTRFAPGEYYLDNSEPTMIIVRSKDAVYEEIAGTLNDGGPVPEQDAKAIFVFRDGRYQLIKIWGLTGQRTLTGHYGEDDAGQLRVVKITHVTLPATGGSSTP